METKEVKIQVPEGYEIDRENSTFECIKFKPKSLTYEDIARKLFYNKTAYYPSSTGKAHGFTCIDYFYMSNNSTSKKQVEKLLALNKLINVAKYLNGDWEPDFSDNKQKNYFIFLYKNEIKINDWHSFNYGVPCFKLASLAKQAVQILGEETIKLALSQV